VIFLKTSTSIFSFTLKAVSFMLLGTVYEHRFDSVRVVVAGHEKLLLVQGGVDNGSMRKGDDAAQVQSSFVVRTFFLIRLGSFTVFVEHHILGEKLTLAGFISCKSCESLFRITFV